MHNQHDTGPLENVRNAGNLVALVAQAGAVTLDVFLHTRLGERYVGLQGAVAILLIPCFGMLFPDEDIRPLFYFLGSYLVMCFLSRMEIMRRIRRGEREHSRYNGWPRLLRRSFAEREQMVKETAEPILVIVGGALTLSSNRPLGFYLMFAALCSMASNRMMREREEQLTADMHDALFEQQQAMARLRRLQGQL